MWRNRTPRENSDVILKSLKMRSRNGTLVSHRPHTTWKAGWRTVGGKRFYARSRWEANYARVLQWRKENGVIVEWEHEPKTFWFEKILRGVRSYLPDFLVSLRGGAHEFHEVKGWMDPKSKTKLKRMKKYHPTERVVVIGKDFFKSRNTANFRLVIPDWEIGNGQFR